MPPPAAVTESRPSLAARILIGIFGAWCALFVAFFALAQVTAPNSVTRAELGMALGLALLWVGVCGGVMLVARRPLRAALRRLPLPWPATFALASISLALIEEAIATTMTNLAPLWGVPVGRAYITASAYYWEVVLYHSVVVFVPMLLTWAWLLTRWSFTPTAVFLLFGLTGTLGESLSFGPQNLLQMGFWVCIYGLMVWLPAGIAPADRPARRPGIGAHLLAVTLPIVAAIPVVIVLLSLHPPQHPFPPITP